MNKNKLIGSVLFVMMLLSLVLVAEAALEIPAVRLSLLNQNPDPAKVGEVVEVRLTVQNVGGAEANNLLVEVVPDYPFTLLTGEEKRQVISYLPNWPEEENSKTVMFRLRVNREATQGQYPLEFRTSVDNGASWKSSEFNIDVVSKEFAEIIYIDKTKLIPGKETEMTFTIHNLGNAPLQNLVFSWNEPDSIVLPVSTDNTRYIKYLGPGEKIPLKYTVIASVNANPDLYKLNLNLEYDIRNESGGTSKETVSTQAGVFVGGETDFDVTFSESSEGQTSLSVANVGSTPALSVTVRIPQQEGFRVTGSTDAIIGNLDKGDYTIVSFQIVQSSVGGLSEDVMEQLRSGELSEEEIQQLRQQQFSQRNNNLKVIIDYTDTTGVRQTLEKTVPIQFRSVDETGEATSTGQFGGMRQQQSTWYSNMTIYLIVFVVILGGIVYYRKRRSANVFLSRLLKKRKS